MPRYFSGFHRVAWLLALVMFSSLATAAAKDDIILEEVEFKGARVQDAVRTISELTGVNIVATGAAGDRPVTLFVRDASVTNIVDSICRISGLWYRHNAETGIFIVMTAEEYQKDIVVFRREPTRMFQLKYLNVAIAARTIYDLFGDRVEAGGRANWYTGDDYVISGLVSSTGVSENTDDDSSGRDSRSGSGGRGRNSSRNNRDRYNDRNGGRTSTDVQGLKDEKLSPTQLALLEGLARGDAASGGPQTVSEEVVGQITQLRNRESPIYVTVNRLHNMLFVRTADEKAMEEIAKIVEESDRQVPEVLLEMRVMEVQLTDQFQSAFNIGGIGGSRQTGPDDGQPANPLNQGTGSVGKYLGGLGNFALQGGSTAVFQVLSDSIRARLQLLEKTNNVRTLATPMLLAANNHPARLFIGEEAVITTGFETLQESSGVTGTTLVVNTVPVPVTEVRSVGNTLTILPSINADRSVVMRIVHENSNIEPNGGNIPILYGGSVRSVPVDTIGTSTLEGTVLAMDGMTVAVGGMMRTTRAIGESKVPLLGDIPGLGFFFREKMKSETKTELVLLITPHVLSIPEQGEEVTRRRLGELMEYPDELNIYLDSQK